MATKILSYMIKPDFIAHMGDVGCGDKTTTPDMLKKQIQEFNNYLIEACNGIPVFIAIGNHDTGTYYHNAKKESGDTNIYTLSGEFLYDNFTKHSVDNND